MSQARGYISDVLRFTKMNGAGNDFVMIDNRAGEVRLQPGQITRICDRHRGVGADGVLLLEGEVGEFKVTVGAAMVELTVTRNVIGELVPVSEVKLVCVACAV